MKSVRDGLHRLNQRLLYREVEADKSFRRLIASIIVFGVPLVLYLAFPNRDYGWDAVMSTLQIENGTAASLFHPHHIIYNPLGFIILRAFESLGVAVSTTSIMQVINSIAGAVGVLLFFGILLKLSNRIGVSTVFALLLAFSMAYWEYAVEVEVYTIPVVFLLASLLLMLDYLSEGIKPRPTLFVKLGLLTSLACLFHQMHILSFVVVFSFVVLTVKGGLQRVKMLGYYLAPFAFLVCGVYVAAAYVTKHLTSFSSFYHWLTLYTHAGAEWGTMGLRNFPLAAYGVFKTFFFKSTMRDFLLTNTVDERDIVLLVVVAAGVLLLAFLAGLTIINMRRIYRYNPRLLSILVVWLFVYGVFGLWYDPLTHELWIPLLPPTWILVFLAVQIWHFPRVRKGLRLLPKMAIPVVLLVLLASVNFVGDVLPNSNIDNNENYQLARKFDSVGATRGDLVLIWGSVPLENYYRLFFDGELRVTSLGRRPWATPPADITKEAWFSSLDKTIEKTLSEGGRVFVSESELKPNAREALAFLGERGLIKVSDYPTFYAKYEDRLTPIFQYTWRGKETGLFEIMLFS